MFAQYGLKSLEKIVFYAAPAEHSPTPYTISEGIQLVELITSGVVFFEVNGSLRPCRRGTVFWHIPGDRTIWQTTRNEPYRCMVFQFQSSGVERMLPRVSCWQSSEQALEDFLNTVHSAFFSNNQTAQQRSALESYCASELIMNALQLKNRSPYAPPGMDGDGDEKLLSTVIAWAEKNSDKLHDIQTMCNVLKIPRNKIFALFKEKLQTTPHRWLREKQLQHARSLLESTTLPIKEIAGLCGFEHVEVFHRSFARQYGETPKQYRTTHFAYQDFMD